MATKWLAQAAAYDTPPRYQGEAEVLSQCAHDLAATWDASMAGNARRDTDDKEDSAKNMILKSRT